MKISYARDFLLSFRDLEECKILPVGFDKSLLSELEDAPQERFRTGGLPSQSYRRVEYGSSPPTKGDTNAYSRASHGRWDSRSSSGKADREGVPHSDFDSDLPKHNGNQSRRPWQVREQDGLLGSGSFPRPSGYAGGAAALKGQLGRGTELYHPPKPHKAGPYSRRESKDSFNDETFSSSELTSEDRVEEERKRRASFELMRKEQQRSFQERKKSAEMPKEAFDFASYFDESRSDGESTKQSSFSDDPSTGQISACDFSKSVTAGSMPASRPAIPPGFSNFAAEKTAKTCIQPPKNEVEEQKMASAPTSAANLGASGEGILEESHRSPSNSALEKLLVSALSVSESGVERGIMSVDDQSILFSKDAAVGESSQNSRFAQWFVEEEKNFPEEPRSQEALLIADVLKITPPLPSPEGFAKAEGFSSVLTCEDVEQSMLSTNHLGTPPPEESWRFPDQSNAAVDNHASHHLLSLLQKGAPPRDEDAPPSTSSKPLTLETLFGSAFMKELKSGGANDADPPRFPPDKTASSEAFPIKGLFKEEGMAGLPHAPFPQLHHDAGIGLPALPHPMIQQVRIGHGYPRGMHFPPPQSMMQAFPFRHEIPRGNVGCSGVPDIDSGTGLDLGFRFR